jgi:phage FluMu protein Com
MPFTIACSKCQKTLMVPDAAVGKKVRCPACKEIVAVPAPPQEAAPDAVTATPAPPTPAKSKPAAPAPWDNDERIENDEDDAPKKKSKKQDEDAFAFSDDDEEDSPRKRKRRRRTEDDDDDDYDDLPRRGRRGVAHRGATILTLGILSIFVACGCPIIAWVMGGIAIKMANADLLQMSTGKMDSSGRGNTQVGKICAIIGVVLGIINGIAGIIIRLNSK